MFIGHYGLALAAKKVAPRVSLGTLILAASLLDLLWPFLLLAGLEHVRIDPGNTAVTPLDFYDYPISHSLLAVLGWAVLLGGVYFFLRRGVREALVVAGLVTSHWFLDALMHRPDLPFYPGSEIEVGLGLWNSIPATIGLELLVFAGGFALYLNAASPLRRKARVNLWFMGGLLVSIWIGNIFGPPPPSVNMIAGTTLSLWLLVWWGDWIDRGSAAR